MPSTSALPPLTIALRRAEILAFWILATAVLLLALAFAAAVLGASDPWAWGVIGLGLPLPALIWPRWLEYGARAWNKGVRLCAALLRAYVLRVAYYLLFSPVGWTGSGLVVGSKVGNSPSWISRSGHRRAFGAGDRLSSAGGWWGRELLASVRTRRTAWQVCLLPVLLLLLVLGDDGQENVIPAGTYTLY